MNSDALLSETAQIIRDTVQCGDVPITRTTCAMDVRGWDSLSHTMVLMRIEDAFGVQLPMERVLQLGTVGELIDLVAELKAA